MLRECRMFIYVCVRVRACVRACALVCVFVDARARVRACELQRKNDMHKLQVQSDGSVTVANGQIGDYFFLT